MRRNGFIVLAVGFIALATLAGCDRISHRFEEYDTKSGARSRVTTMLEGIKNARGKSDQKSLCLWYDGSIYINDEHDQSFASDAFDRWRVDGGLGQGIEAFEVTEAVFEPDAEVPTALVSGSIDGNPFWMRVPKGQSIAWVAKPKKASRWD